MKTASLILAAVALVCGASAEEPKKNPKEAVERLLHQAREAKEAGRLDQAEKLQAEAERIMAELRGKDVPKEKEGAKDKDAIQHKEGVKEGSKEGEKRKDAPNEKEAMKKEGLKEGSKEGEKRKDAPNEKEAMKKEGLKEGSKEGEKRKEMPREKEVAKKGEKGSERIKFTAKAPESERLQHIMQAVDHLHAGGLHEQAKAIEHAAQELRRDLESHQKREGVESHAKVGKHPGEKKAHGELDEMRQQLRKMAEQLEHLQAEMKKRGS